MLTNIYVASGPDGRVRYVGKTVKSLARRLQLHKTAARRGSHVHRCNWIRSVNYEVTLDLVETVEGDGAAEEIALIAGLRKLGLDLVNMTAGGEGVSNPPPEVRRKMGVNRGRKLGPPSAEARAKNAAAHRGLKHTAATLQKMAEKRKLRPPPSEETRAKLSRAGLGRKNNPITEETRARMAAVQKGKRASVETRAKMAAAQAKRAARERAAKALPILGP